MPDTYTQVYIHMVFAVKLRQFMIKPSFSGHLERYITGIVQKKGSKIMAIKTMPDHMHLLVSLNPNASVSDLARDIKACSSGYIKKAFNCNLFSWQTGYGAFSYSKSQLKQVAGYIQKQEEHHRQKSFKEEYMKILMDFGVEYDEKYLFTWISDVEEGEASN